MMLAILFWWFIAYVGQDWEAPERIIAVRGPYPEQEVCIRAKDDWATWPQGSIMQSPCFAGEIKPVKNRATGYPN